MSASSREEPVTFVKFPTAFEQKRLKNTIFINYA